MLIVRQEAVLDYVYCKGCGMCAEECATGTRSAWWRRRHDDDLKPMPAVQQLAVMEGSMAIAQAVTASRPGVISAYPITPQTHIVEFLAQHGVADGELTAEYIQR